MKRRTFLSALAASSAPAALAAYPSVMYTSLSWPDLRDSRRKVVLNFRAEWSLTCRIKQDMLTELIAERPHYAQLTFVDVDWDTFGPSNWVERQLAVERRSTLLGLKNGTEEIARLVNQPFKERIGAFLDTVVAA